MSEETTEQRIERLRTLIAKREGQTGYAKNVAQMKAELASLEAE